jgi:hypothetical protein
VKFEQPDAAGAYDRYELKLSKQVGPLVKEWCDVLLFGNYFTKVDKVVLPLIACSPGLTQINFSQGNSDSQTWTTFSLPTTATTVAITIQSG